MLARSHDFIVKTCAYFTQKVCPATSDWKFINVCFGNSVGTFGADCTEHALSENLNVWSVKERLETNVRLQRLSSLAGTCSEANARTNLPHENHWKSHDLLDPVMYVLPKQRIWETLSHFKNGLASLVYNYQPRHVRTAGQVCSLKVVAAKILIGIRIDMSVTGYSCFDIRTRANPAYAGHFQRSNAKRTKMTRTFELCCAQHPHPSTS